MTEQPDSIFSRVAEALAAEYELLRPLGRGGMAVVFLAREHALKRLVAIKVLDPELGAIPLFRTRFQREAETAAQLQHPHIVPIYRVGEAAGVSYYAMGYVEGESLAERMQREGRLPLAEALRLAREVAGALAAAHRRGIVHRDVKPQNILLERETGRALVTDFGIARVAQLAGGSDADRLTGMGLVMGTPRYMSPEQAAGDRDVTAAADLYALGVVWYEMLTGAYPYKMPGGGGALAIPFSHPQVPVRERTAEVPVPIAELVQRLLALDPAGRPASADTVVQALEGTITLPPPLGGRRTLSRRTRRLATLAGVFAVGLPLFLFLVRPGGPRIGVDPRKSILIGFFENTTRDPGIEWLRLGGVELLSQSLKRWQDLQVVDVERLLDLARRANVESGAALSRDDAVRLARAAGVWTTTVGSILRLGDRVRITVRVYDVTTRRQLTSASVDARPDSTLPVAFASLADQILDVAGVARAALRDVEPPTRSLAAYEAYIEGIAARSRWDMTAAVAAFRRAVAADHAFALAYYEWSGALIGSQFLTPDAQFVALADSANRYADGRPPVERLLIQAYHAWVRADLPRARDLARQVLVLDSTATDAWVILGDASWIDLTLVKDAQGRDSLPSSPTRALQSYERALALDQSDHRLFANLASILVLAAFGDERQLPAFRTPIAGSIQRVMFRVPARYYQCIYQGDTLVLVPADSVDQRYPQALRDSLQRSARQRMQGVLDRWLAVAPGEGQPHLLLAQLRSAEKDYDGAVRGIEQAMRVGATSPVPLEYMKLSLQLQGRQLSGAVGFLDTLSASGRLDSVIGAAPLTASPVVSAELVAGRVDRADRLWGDLVAAARTIAPLPPDIEPVRTLNEAAVRFLMRSKTERVTPGGLARATAEFERLVAALADSMRPNAREAIGHLLSFAAAGLGDTATVRRRSAPSRGLQRHGAAAWGAAVAGDRATAERMLAAAANDTVRSPSNVFALARAAELLGRPAVALRHYERLDSLSYEGGETAQGPDTDWLLLVRSYPGRAAMYEALGDTTRAREYYRRFISLWRDADDALRPEVERAERALGLPPRRETN